MPVNPYGFLPFSANDQGPDHTQIPPALNPAQSYQGTSGDSSRAIHRGTANRAPSYITGGQEKTPKRWADDEFAALIRKEIRTSPVPVHIDTLLDTKFWDIELVLLNVSQNAHTPQGQLLRELIQKRIQKRTDQSEETRSRALLNTEASLVLSHRFEAISLGNNDYMSYLRAKARVCWSAGLAAARTPVDSIFADANLIVRFYANINNGSQAQSLLSLLELGERASDTAIRNVISTAAANIPTSYIAHLERVLTNRIANRSMYVRYDQVINHTNTVDDSLFNKNAGTDYLYAALLITPTSARDSALIEKAENEFKRISECQLYTARQSSEEQIIQQISEGISGFEVHQSFVAVETLRQIYERGRYARSDNYRASLMYLEYHHRGMSPELLKTYCEKAPMLLLEAIINTPPFSANPILRQICSTEMTSRDLALSKLKTYIDQAGLCMSLPENALSEQLTTYDNEMLPVLYYLIHDTAPASPVLPAIKAEMLFRKNIDSVNFMMDQGLFGDLNNVPNLDIDQNMALDFNWPI